MLERNTESITFWTKCPPSWKLKDNVCYYKPDEKANFNSAEATCKQLGGKLAEPINNRENQNILDLSDENFYIGIHDRAKEKEYNSDHFLKQNDKNFVSDLFF